MIVIDTWPDGHGIIYNNMRLRDLPFGQKLRLWLTERPVNWNAPVFPSLASPHEVPEGATRVVSHDWGFKKT